MTVVNLPGEHVHTWVRVPDSVSFFACADPGCLWRAVCPGCLQSVDVALWVRAGIPGLALYWCPVHLSCGEGGINDLSR